MTKDEECLLVSLYEWCKQTTEREIESNCPTLSRLKSSAAAAFADFMSVCGTQAGAKAVAFALVKRFHLRALKLNGEEFTREDQQLIDDFINFARFKRFGAKDPAAAMKARKNISKAKLSHALQPLLEPVLGKAELLEGSVSRYEIAAEPFRIATYVDVGGRIPLRYSHKIIGPSGPLCETSLLHWHGIATETAWDSMKPKDVDSSTQQLAELCTRFLTAAETLCKGSCRWRTNG